MKLDMSILVNVLTIFVGIGIILWVIRLIVKKQMSESQSVLWIGIGIAAIIFGCFPQLISWIAGRLGIWYPPSVLLLFATVGLLLILFYNTTVVSVHGNEIHEIAIQIALLKEENKTLKTQLEEMKKRQG